MIIGRIFAFISFSLMIMVLGAEGLRFLQKNDEGWITVSQIFEFVFAVKMNASGQFTVNNDASSPWVEALNWASDFPAFLLFLISTCLLAFIFRNRLRK